MNYTLFGVQYYRLIKNNNLIKNYEISMKNKMLLIQQKNKIILSINDYTNKLNYLVRK